MAQSDAAAAYLERMNPGATGSLATTDPEFAERFNTFAFDEVVNEEAAKLPDRERFLAILAALMGCQGVDEFRVMVAGALNFGVTPVEVKEVVYQGTAYLGIGRTLPFIRAVNEVFAERAHINKWLADNCFGDYYTRNGLSDRDREMITFCFIAAQGGCEPQLTSHAMGNMNLGNDKDFLYRVVSQCVPYIGYPRSLNALACVDKAAEQLSA
ncbi:carboxymuconolactone decarboxylase family protein [Enorma massiliensis]|uniref:carboxymuconolactone decarboxylase family protein n=1 Tax=Enorma massiliensis TaxID=1472761 RepID=UPI002E7A402D|nr:carboxymuconolactone decarboxylase family protein [Enorma massiliensis]